MTTNRTAIRRRLAIRGTAHRPPWGARKAGHGSIVAPLAATVAATVTVAVGVGVGVVLAHSERERRRARERQLEDERKRKRRLKRDRQLALAPSESLADGLRRMALGQLDMTLELLGAGAGANTGADGAPGGGAVIAGPPDERAVHETRKALKRVRAVLRLLEGELGAKTCAREHAALRNVAGSLAGARDGAVMLSTLDALIKRHPRTLGRRRGVLELRRRVRAEHARMERETLADPAGRAAVLGELQALRWRVAAWSLSDRDGIALIEADLEKLYRQGRGRRLRVVRRKGDRTIAMHEWRKRVKDLRYVAEMLERRGGDSSPDANGSGQSGRAGERLRKIARRADALGELLGEEHDLAVLAAHLRAGELRGRENESWRTGRRSRERLLRAIAKRRRVLRKRALRDGGRLYKESPRKFVRRIGAAHARQARDARGLS
jgi:CHAD domain-containing protein